jgi:hypothetical protein
MLPNVMIKKNDAGRHLGLGGEETFKASSVSKNDAFGAVRILLALPSLLPPFLVVGYGVRVEVWLFLEVVVASIVLA